MYLIFMSTIQTVCVSVPDATISQHQVPFQIIILYLYHNPVASMMLTAVTERRAKFW